MANYLKHIQHTGCCEGHILNYTLFKIEIYGKQLKELQDTAVFVFNIQTDQGQNQKIRIWGLKDTRQAHMYIKVCTYTLTRHKVSTINLEK